jgi:hypothetical protein
MAITDIVKCEDEKEFLIWKYPEEIFKTTTKLIVGAGKEAVFLKKVTAMMYYQKVNMY